MPFQPRQLGWTHSNRMSVVKPKNRMYVNHKHRRITANYTSFFWRRITDPEYMKPSIWVGDFKHRYLMATGRDYTGPVPASPAPGMYQNMFSVGHLSAQLSGAYKPSRESRMLPIMPVTPRTAYEYRREVRQDFFRQQATDRRQIQEMKETEFHEWYMKLQRVRGKWCRENSIRSRGVYGPAVDAAEIWG